MKTGVAVLVLFLAFATVAKSQNAACLTAGSTLQSACMAYQSTTAQNANLSGADDATLTAAIKSSSVKPSVECCTAAQAFNAPSPPCGCDAALKAVAASQNIQGDGLLTLQRVLSISCGLLSPSIVVAKPAQTTCAATSG